MREIIELITPIYKDELTELDLEISSGELVRCKNCKYGEQMCQPWSDIVCTQNRATHIPEWFCADGEKK